MMNVKDFGAKGNGTNATEAFQKAADAVPASGGVLYIPAGAYGLTERIVIRDKPIKVLGDGIGISKVIWAAHAKTSGLVIIQSRVQQINTDFTYVTQLSLYTHQANRDTALTVDLKGQVHPTAHVIMNRTNARISLEKLEIRGEDGDKQGWKKAILLDHGHHAVLNQIHITGRSQGGGEVGIHLEGGQGSPTEVQVSQCWAFYVNKALYVTGSMEGVKLSQCDFVAVAHGVYAEHCLQMNVNNSHINATHCCIYACNVNQSSFSNLLLYKTDESCAGVGIQVCGDSARNIISSNIFANPTRHAQMHAVVLEGKAHHCLVANCVFMNAGSGILCQGGATNCQASFNSFESPGPSCKWQQGHHSNTCSGIV
jgi:hypothetical protein